MLIGSTDLGHRSETVRRANLRSIVRELHGSGTLSRSDLVARTGLTRSAIRALTGELIAGDLATERPATLDGTPGRPSPLVRLDPHGAVVIALEIAVDSLAVAAVGLGGEVFSVERIGLPRGRSSVADIAAALAELATRVRSGLIDGDSIVGVGVAVVGIVRRSDGMVALAPNLGWRDEPLGEHLAAALGIDAPIAFANESDLAALAEVRRGAARNVDDVVLIWGSVGVGGGLIVGGEPLTGSRGLRRRGRAHPRQPGRPALPLRVDRLLGDRGRRQRDPAAGRLSAGGWTGRPRRGPGRRRGRVTDGPRRLRRDRPLARHRPGRSHQHPESRSSSCIGGRFAPSYPFLRTALEAELDRRVLRASRRLVRVIPATLGVDAPLLGAAELAFEPLLSDPAAWLRPRHALAALASA